nr:hypothetical protein Itr_chr01CG24610 [Ipomoea trifida]
MRGRPRDKGIENSQLEHPYDVHQNRDPHVRNILRLSAQGTHGGIDFPDHLRLLRLGNVDGSQHSGYHMNRPDLALGHILHLNHKPPARNLLADHIVLVHPVVGGVGEIVKHYSLTHNELKIETSQ